MVTSERELSGLIQGTWIRPDNPLGPGMVLLGGSSGTVPVERARLLAQIGVQVIALRWFGGEGQSPGICEIPLETITAAVDMLVDEGCTRIGVLGTSKGAEAALLARAVDQRVAAIFAFSPTSVVWANVGPGLDGYSWPLRSSFTWRGEPFSFVPHSAEALLSLRQLPPISYVEFFEKSLHDFPERVKSAAIPLESMGGHTVLIAGSDDQLWPSAQFARELEVRAKVHGSSAVLLIHAAAGHRVLLPGETTPKSKLNEHGGTDVADAELGTSAWTEILRWIG